MEKRYNPFSDTGYKKMMFCSVTLPLIMMLFAVSSSAVGSWYIKPSTEVPLRRGQGTDYKIDAILPDGTEVNVLEEEGAWVRVTTLNGKEGWILKRYLSQEKPLNELVETLRRENAFLKEGQTSVAGKNEEMDRRNEQLQQEVDSCVAELTQIRGDYQTLQNDTADVIRIKNDLAASQELVTSLHQELSGTLAANEKLKDNQKIKWFLSGGGTLVFGCLVGMMFSRSRKRKPSLY